MPGRFPSLLCIALCFHIAAELDVGVASQTTDSATVSTTTSSPGPQTKMIVNLELRFEVHFNESYRDNSSAAYQAMLTGFNTTFSTVIYQDKVLSLAIVDVKNGSVIVDLQLNLNEFVNETQLRRQLDSYIESCKNMTATNNSNCFDFGPAPNVTEFVTEDKQCDTFFCRNGTICEIGANNVPRCVCPPGYNMTNATSSNDTSGDFQCEAVPTTCYLSEQNICLRNATDNSTICDPCFGSPIICNQTLGQICVGNATCAPVCGCPRNKVIALNGTCLDACAALSPCLNGGNCTANSETFNYTCTCPAEYSGTDCSQGPQTKMIVKLGLRFEVDFNASYCDNSSAAYQAMFTGFNATFSTAIYQDNLLSIAIVDVRNGSVIVDLQLNLKEFVNETQLRRQLDSYIESCKNMTATNNSNCFDFGPAPNVTEFVTEDKQCDTFFCRNGTVCEIDANNVPRCVCPPGYNMTNATSSNDTSGDFQCEAVPTTCYLSEQNICLRNATDNSTICDPCFGSPIICNETLGQICVGNATCAPVCGCPWNKVIALNGTCLDACAALSPCLNGGNCSANSETFNYTCTCPAEYSGTNCSQDVDECDTNRPSKCPLNNYFCENTKPGYNCGCQSGFILNETANNCDKVNQILKTTITLEFEYRANFKNKSSEDYKVLLNNFTQAFQIIYVNSSILSIEITDVREGSIVVFLTLNFKDYADNRKELLQQYIDRDCANGTKCFGLGPFENKTDGDYMDTRCEGILCPANTKCVPLDGDRLSCVCDGPGFNETGDIGGAGYGLVTKLESCQDIDECSGPNNCTTKNEQCTNTVGSYQCSCPNLIVDGVCSLPCSSNPCGTDGECEKIDDRSYRCVCNWTHTGRNCDSALPLIFMILACVFIVLFLIAVGIAVYCCRKAQKGKLVVNDSQPLVGRTAAWRSTEL